MEIAVARHSWMTVRGTWLDRRRLQEMEYSEERRREHRLVLRRFTTAPHGQQNAALCVMHLKIRRAAKGVWKSAGSKVRQRDSVSMNVIALSPQLKYKALTKAEKSA